MIPETVLLKKKNTTEWLCHGYSCECCATFYFMFNSKVNNKMKFNEMLKEATAILNHEGDVAYTISPEMELYTAVVTSSLSDKFYEPEDKQTKRIAELIGKVSAEFVAKLAIYTRTEMHLRSVLLLLIVLLAKAHRGDNLVAKTIERVVLRADEIMELLMCYQLFNPSEGRKKLGRLSHQVQTGLQRAFNNFDEYQFAKYNRNNIEVKLRDALFVVHPKAKDSNQQAIFNKIANNCLSTPYTWETELSALGQENFEDQNQKTEAFRSKWTELIKSNKMGYMALLRNLRNMLEAGVAPAPMEQVCNHLSAPEQVRKSKQLPFRFLSAYKELKQVNSISTTMVLNALEDAMRASAANIAGFSKHSQVLIACDVSGSMSQTISQRSKVRLSEVGIVLAMLFRNSCKNVITGIFGDIWKVTNFPTGSILSGICEMEKHCYEVGFSTNGHKVIEWLLEQHIIMDKVMIFTDCQMWDSTGKDKTFAKLWHRYKQLAPKAQLYLFDLAGYGTAPLRTEANDVFLIGGWSDRIFDVLHDLQNGKSALDKINSIEL